MLISGNYGQLAVKQAEYIKTALGEIGIKVEIQVNTFSQLN